MEFQRDIRPLLSDRCFACHGPDVGERKAKLRLDQSDGPEGAYRTHDGITSIKPGSLEDSELWYRITTTDQDDRMPPEKAHKKLLETKGENVVDVAANKQAAEVATAVYEHFESNSRFRGPMSDIMNKYSEKLKDDDLNLLGINRQMRLSNVFDDMKPYLSRHRKEFFSKN